MLKQELFTKHTENLRRRPAIPADKTRLSGDRRVLMRNILLGGVNRNLLTILAQTLKADNAVSLGEQGVVGTLAHVGAGVNVGAALANKDVASQNELTVSTLGAKALGLGITAVLGGAHTFFMGEELQTNVQHFAVPSFL